MNPLLIASLPRSGSSCVAGLFYINGYGCGRSRPPDRHNAKGYYEDLDVKAVFKKAYGSGHDGKVAEPKPGLAEKIRAAPKVNKTPWFIKFGSWYLPAMLDAYPDSPILFVRRDLDSIRASGRRSFRVTEPRIKTHLEMVDRFSDREMVFTVDFERILALDFKQLDNVFALHLVSPDIPKMEAFVDPKLSKKR